MTTFTHSIAHPHKGHPLTFHKLHRVESEFSKLTVQVLSWGSEDDYLAGKGAEWSTYQDFAASDEFTASILNLLLGEGVFAGAQPKLDPSADLEVMRARRWNTIRAHRDAFEHSGFDVPGFGRFDSDTASQLKLVGAAMRAALAPEGFTVQWTLQDNSVVELVAGDFADIGHALQSHLNATHQRGRALREQLDAATTIEQVNAVAW